VALFGLSYDTVEILAGFAEKHGIAFPLLSDRGSHVMRRLGLLNPRVQEDHAAYGIAPSPRHVDLPYPGVFLLDERGAVAARRFHESYRERDTGAGLLAALLSPLAAGPGPDAQDGGDGAVRARAWLDSPTYCLFQRLHLHVEVAVAAGFHVYGQPVPGGYTPLSLDVDPIDGLERGPAAWPAPHRFAIDGLPEEFWVHDGAIRAALPLTFAAAPGGGDHVVRATVRYQACSASACLPPSELRLEVPVREVALVDRELPATTPSRAPSG
jgi:hypothetical protein